MYNTSIIGKAEFPEGIWTKFQLSIIVLTQSYQLVDDMRLNYRLSTLHNKSTTYQLQMRNFVVLNLHMEHNDLVDMEHEYDIS